MLKYRAEIDGLRAIAVTAVILFHAGFSFISGGYTGVDVFFVISGFLITGIILPKIKDGNFSLREFYEKRARRLLPAVYIVFLFSTIGAWVTLLPSQFKDYAKSLISAIFGVSNIFFFKTSDYWDTATELKPLIHTWSLGVEEQFYFIFPLILLALTLFLKGRFYIFVTLLVTAISFLASVLLVNKYPDFTFYLLPTRAWEMGLGGVGAMINFNSKGVSLANRVSPIIKQILAYAGIGMILTPFFLFTHSTVFPGLSALPSCVGTILVLLFASNQTHIGKFLTFKPLVIIGLMSYSLYLWHQPIFAFFRIWWITPPSLTQVCALIAATFVGSWLSLRFIETPFRNRSFLTAKQFYTGVVVSSAVFLVGAAIVLQQKGFSEREVVKSLQILDFEPDNKKLRIQSWAPLITKTGSESYSVKNNPEDLELWFDDKSKPHKVLLVGNSFSKDLYNVLSNSKYSAYCEFARFGIKTENIDHKLFNCPNYKMAETIIICSRYTEKDLKVLPKLIDKIVVEKKLIIVEPFITFSEVNGFTVADKVLIKALRKSNSNQQGFTDSTSEINSLYSEEFESYKFAPYETSLNEIFREKGTHSDVLVVNRADYLKSSNGAVIGLTNRLAKTFYDYGHHTIAGSVVFGRNVSDMDWLDEVLIKAPRD